MDGTGSGNSGLSALPGWLMPNSRKWPVSVATARRSPSHTIGNVTHPGTGTIAAFAASVSGTLAPSAGGGGSASTLNARSCVFMVPSAWASTMYRSAASSPSGPTKMGGTRTVPDRCPVAITCAHRGGTWLPFSSLPPVSMTYSRRASAATYRRFVPGRRTALRSATGWPRLILPIRAPVVRSNSNTSVVSDGAPGSSDGDWRRSTA